ncbi:MAG: hypothetical protein M3271_09880, partial [Actinomycetota bacterium]|nr:hypothetical protein [Actinomycetota bacterium]
MPAPLALLIALVIAGLASWVVYIAVASAPGEDDFGTSPVAPFEAPGGNSVVDAETTARIQRACGPAFRDAFSRFGRFASDEERSVQAIARIVEKVRGLRFERPVRAEFLTPGALRKRVARQIGKDYSQSEARRDAAILAALGAISPDVDLRTVVTKGVSGQVIGFYVPETKELV